MFREDITMSFNRYSVDYKAHNELRQLRKQVEDFESGERYQKLIKEYEEKLAKKERELKRAEDQISRLEEQCRLLKTKYSELETELFFREGDVSRLTDWVNERDLEINELKKEAAENVKEIERLKALLNTDGANSGTPTSQTPSGKEKIRPNSRVKTGKKAGGQSYHQKHKLNAFDDKEITDYEDHLMEACPRCKGELADTEKTIEKDETEMEVVVHRIRHIFRIYRCLCCGREVHIPVPNHLKEDNQYGPETQAVALSLMNTGNVPINKVGMIIRGMTDNKINPSDGYIAKIQAKAAARLRKFRDDLRNLLIAQPVLYWDDTVIMVDKRRACIRFYGNEKIAWYAAHARKNLDGIKEDAILQNLSEDTYVMHDHNTVNYNSEFRFRNLECNVHLVRDLQKVIEILGHSWAYELKELIQNMIHRRKELIDSGINCFGETVLADFRKRIRELLNTAGKQNNADFSKYYGSEEKALINRLKKYMNNYFLWVERFDLPVSDNLSERGLRCIKSHMKISGQFRNTVTADNYTLLKTYIETCRKNGINEVHALKRLCTNNPYTVQEIFKLNKA